MNESTPSAQPDDGQIVAFNRALDAATLGEAWNLGGELRRQQVDEIIDLDDGIGGRWRIVLADHDPENTAACGIVEDGQYTAVPCNAVPCNAVGPASNDYVAEPFTDLTTRGEAAARLVYFLYRVRRQNVQRAARAAAATKTEG